MDGILNSIVDSSLVSEKYREKITKEELIETIGLVQDAASLFEEIHLKTKNIEITYCAIRLKNACISYLYDYHRYADFHDCKGLSHEKQVAFMWKWLSKIRPYAIEMDDTTSEDYDYYQNMINSLLCIFYFRYILNKKAKKYFNTKMMCYELHYGSTTVNTLISIFEK